MVGHGLRIGAEGMNEKTCSKCGIPKTPLAFYAIGNVCKVCQIARQTAYRNANYRRVRAAERRREKSPEYRDNKNARQRAQRAAAKQGSAA